MMKMIRLSSKLILISLVIVIGVFSLAIHPKEPVVFKSPNIILFSADTLRADHLSCYGYSRNTSPNIDAFAKDSVLFQNAISQAPATTEAHMSIFTSLTPPVHLCTAYHPNPEGIQFSRLDEKNETLPQLFKKNDYLTLGFHGGTNMAGVFGFDKGFDSYRLWEDLREPKDRLEDVAKAIQESKHKGKPLFLFLHNYICHAPYLRSPPEFSLKFLSERVPGLPMPEDDFRTMDIPPAFYKAFWKNVDLSNPQHLKHIISLYDGGIAYEDHIFGKVVEILKREKLYDNSIIIFLSDHGEEFYEHFGKEHGRLFIEHLHVPLIIKFPGNRFGGRVVAARVRTMDLMPTLFDFLNMKIKPMIQGISFSPLITGVGGYAPLIVSYRDSYEMRFIKEFFAYSNQKIKMTKDWLFDIRKDPREQNNLAVKDARVTGQMRLLIEGIKAENKAFREKIGSQPTLVPVSKDDELVSQLRSLGYLQ